MDISRKTDRSKCLIDVNIKYKYLGILRVMDIELNHPI